MKAVRWFRHPAEAGFTLVELLLACALLLMISAGFLAAATPAIQVTQAEPEAVDLQQRVRLGADLLMRDLYAAGAGLDSGPMTGSLGRYFAPVLPRRLVNGADAPATARADAISLIWVPATYAQSTLVTPLAGTIAEVGQQPGCPPALSACGLTTGMGSVVFDASAHFDLFRVEQVTGTQVTLRPRGTASGYVYPAAAAVSEVETRIYYLDPIARQLRMSNGDATDVPVLDDVVQFRVDYFGDADPPTRPRPELGVANCLYDAAGSRLPSASPTLATEDGLAVLPLSIFTDGPWCGSGFAAFDADLLRVRRVRITLGLQAAPRELRGIGSGFSHAGTSRSVWRAVPDAHLVFDVAPRNLGQ